MARRAVRALGALARDMVLLWLTPGPRRPVPDGHAVFVATLPGANGWGSLKPAVAAARAAGLPVAVVAHPRCRARMEEFRAAAGASAGWLPRPPFSALGDAAATAIRHLLRRGGRGEAVCVAATLARGVLWRAAWRRALGAGGGVLVLHNDFDMMSAAALDHGWRTLCVQHGVPTEEFFPARADVQAVWGPSSAAAYRAAGMADDRLVIDALGRDAPLDPPEQPPAGIALISQTHTRVYGDEIARRLAPLAAALGARAPGCLVLLHPGEAPDRHPYTGLTGVTVRQPPHPLLAPGCPPHLVVGFCSTALLDALRAGHYVVGLDWPATRSAVALDVAAPPRRVRTADEVVALFDELRASADARAGFADELSGWMARTFSPERGAFVARLSAMMR